jgi:PAS domain S-box-containing protein
VLNLSFGHIEPFTHPRQRELILLSGVVANIIKAFFLKSQVEDQATDLRAQVARREQEIMDRLIMEEALRESQAKYIELFQHSSDAIIICDADGIVQETNHRVLDLFGYNPGEIPGKSILELATANSVANCKECLEKLPEAGSVELVVEFNRKDGGVFIGEAAGRILEIAGSTVIQVLLRDVTERIKTEEQLKKWADIFRHADWGIAVISADGRTIEMMNPAYYRMHGYDKGELDHKPLDTVLTQQTQGLVDHRKEMTGHLGHLAFESTHIKKDGDVFPALVDASAIRDSQGNILHWVLNTQDLTKESYWRPSCCTPRRWNPSARWPAGWPMISTTSSRPSAVTASFWSSRISRSTKRFPTLRRSSGRPTGPRTWCKSCSPSAARWSPGWRLSSSIPRCAVPWISWSAPYPR